MITTAPSLVVFFASATLNLGPFYHGFSIRLNPVVKAIKSFFRYKACVKCQQFRIFGILKAKIKDLEQLVLDLQESKFEAENISNLFLWAQFAG